MRRRLTHAEMAEASLPYVDTEHDPAVDLTEDFARAGMVLYIHYETADGEESERQIRVNRVEQRPNGLMVVAFCFSRERVRCFRADRMTLLASARTGEIIEDPVSFFSAIAEAAPTKPYAERRAAFRTVRDLVRAPAMLLMSMARADKILHPEEVRLVEHLIDDGQAVIGGRLDHQDLLRLQQELTSLSPSPNLISRAVRLVMEQGFPADLPQLLTAMAKVDGRVVVEEIEAYRSIIATMRRIASDPRKP